MMRVTLSLLCIAVLYAGSALGAGRLVFLVDIDEVCVSSDVRDRPEDQRRALEAQGLVLRPRANNKIYRVVSGARELPHFLRTLKMPGRETVVGVFSSYGNSGRSREIAELLWGPPASSPISFLLLHEALTRVDATRPEFHAFPNFPLDKKKDVRKVPGYSDDDWVFLIDDSPGLILRGQERSLLFVHEAKEAEHELLRIAGLVSESIRTAVGTGRDLPEVLWNLQWDVDGTTGASSYRRYPDRDRYFTQLGFSKLRGRGAAREAIPGLLPPAAVVAPPAALVPAPAVTGATVPIESVLPQLNVGLVVRTAGGLELRLLERAYVGSGRAVWRAALTASAREVALKVNTAGATGREALLADARRARRIEARGLGDWMARVIEENDDYVVKEWVPMETGAQWLARQTPRSLASDPGTAALRALVTEGVARGVYVRLLEPEHVAFDGEGRARILTNGGILEPHDAAQVRAEYRRNFERRWASTAPPGCGEQLIAALFPGDKP